MYIDYRQRVDRASYRSSVRRYFAKNGFKLDRYYTVRMVDDSSTTEWGCNKIAIMTFCIYDSISDAWLKELEIRTKFWKKFFFRNLSKECELSLYFWELLFFFFFEYYYWTKDIDKWSRRETNKAHETEGKFARLLLNGSIPLLRLQPSPQSLWNAGHRGEPRRRRHRRRGPASDDARGVVRMYIHTVLPLGESTTSSNA